MHVMSVQNQGSSAELALMAGRKVALQPGCLQTLTRAKGKGLPVHVISVNWSEELVKAALGVPHDPHAPSSR